MCGQLFGPLWANLAEILADERANAWLWMIQISLGCNEVYMSSGGKSAEKLWFSLFFAFDCQAPLPIVWPPVGQFGRYFRRCMGVWIHDYSWFKLIARTKDWGNIRGRSPLILSHKWPQATCSLVYLFQVNSPFYFIPARVAGYAGACPQHI